MFMSALSAFAPAASACYNQAARGRPQRRYRVVACHASVTAVPILTELQCKCATPLPVLRLVADSMTSDMSAGLTEEGVSDLPMIPSFVYSLPTGNEKGLFYALDFGGTHFRVLRVQLGGMDSRVIDTEYKKVAIPQKLMFGTTEDLFDFFASQLEKFLETEGERFHHIKGRKREMGFTFSFPVKQTSIDSGILIKWTKGFAVAGTAGRDVVVCLNEAMQRKHLDMHVSALVNDTVSTLAGARYWDEDVMAAVILGTGTNACYIERMDCIPKLKGHVSSSGRTILNLEWGAFATGLPLTEFDNDMDAASINPGEQIFEKTISGMYLGEIVRRVLLKISEATTLFGIAGPRKLSESFSLGTPDVSAILNDTTSNLETVDELLHQVAGIASPSLIAKKVVVQVSNAIVKRGGRLAGAGIVGVLQKLERDSPGLIFGKRTVVAMDGGLYEHLPQYRKYLQEAVNELLGPEISRNIIIDHTKDGSGIGAALLAASNSMYANGV